MRVSGGTNFKTLIGIDGIPRHACHSSLEKGLAARWEGERERKRERERARPTKSLYTVEKRGGGLH